MFNRKLFTITIFLLFGKVDNGDPCDQWYLDFPTKFHCEEYYRKHSTKVTVTVTTITTKPTPTTSSTTTSTNQFIPTTSTSFATPIDYPTSSTSTELTTSTTSTFIPTISEPTAEPDDYSTIITTVTMTTSTSTTENVTNGTGNRTPWFLSLWAMIMYT